MNDTSPPLVAFWRDFWLQIDKWIEEGDQLVIAGDWNIDVRKRHFLLRLNKEISYLQ